MQRRTFIRKSIVILGAASAIAVRPLAVRAQTKIARIGYLSLGTPAGTAGRVEALRAGLRDLGYTEGKDIEFEFRFAETTDQLRELAAELVRENVDVIFALSSTEVEAARQATQLIPIVFAGHADPLGLGHVASLARPGGNITGLSVQVADLAGKELGLLKEAVPQAKKIGVLYTPTAPSHRTILDGIESIAPRLGIHVQMAAVQAVEEFEGAFAVFSEHRVDGVFVHAASLTARARNAPQLIAELTLRHRLPSVFGIRENVVAGGLMSYSPNANDSSRRSAVYIDKILKGVKPADLAVQQATKFELVINLKTAKALGLSIPPLLLAQADEVIE